LILSLPGVIVILIIKSYRWHLLLKQSGIHFSIKDSISTYLASFAAGVVTPVRLGEFIKVYNVRQETSADLVISFRKTLTDRFYDLILLLLFALSWIIRYLSNKEISHFSASFISLILIASLLFLFRIVLSKFLSGKKGTVSKILFFFYECIADMTDKKSFCTWLISFVAYFIYFLTAWFLSRSVNIPLTFIETGYVICILGLVLLLPISIAGFGTREISLVYLLSMYGIDSESSLTFSFLQFLIFFAWGGLIGMIFWIINPTPLDAIKSDAKKIFSIIKGKLE
jgi:hypothetical protein